jgi:formamidopyrimidine-DNA glycosylase
MPELPEVEIERRWLERWCAGHTIVDVLARPGTPLRGIAPKALVAGLVGQRVRAIRRHGKQLFFELERGGEQQTLLAHLGMTGHWLKEAEWGPSEVRLTLGLDDGVRVSFVDPRRFGRIRLLSPARARTHKEVASLGPDAYVAAHTPGAFFEALGRSRASIKIALLDQHRVAGVGNIYASEALWRARIHPATPAIKLGKARLARLAAGVADAMDETLRVEEGGVRYVNADPDAVDRFRVYDHAGELCPRCRRAKIRRIVQGARSTYYCPRCQVKRR